MFRSTLPALLASATLLVLPVAMRPGADSPANAYARNLGRGGPYPVAVAPAPVVVVGPGPYYPYGPYYGPGRFYGPGYYYGPRRYWRRW